MCAARMLSSPSQGSTFVLQLMLLSAKLQCTCTCKPAPHQSLWDRGQHTSSLCAAYSSSICIFHPCIDTPSWLHFLFKKRHRATSSAAALAHLTQSQMPHLEVCMKSQKWHCTALFVQPSALNSCPDAPCNVFPQARHSLAAS